MFWFILGLVSVALGLYFYGGLVLGLLVLAGTFLGGAAAVVLTFGTFPFSLLAVTVAVFLAWCVSDANLDLDDHYGKHVWSGTAVTTLIVFCVLFGLANQNLFSLDGFAWYSKLGLFLGGFAAYLVVGGGHWSMYRYGKFGSSRMRAIEAWRHQQLTRLALECKLLSEQDVALAIRNYSPGPHSTGDSPDYRAYCAAGAYQREYKNRIDAARPQNHKERIMVWIGLWPFSMVSWFLRDPVKLVYEQMLGIYERIYNRTVGKLDVQYKAVYENPEQ